MLSNATLRLLTLITKAKKAAQFAMSDSLPEITEHVYY